MWQTLVRLGVPERSLEDLLHEVLMVVHKQLSQYDPSRPLRPWLFGITFRVSAAHMRKASTARELLDKEGDVESIDARPDAEQQVIKRQALDLVKALLEELPPDQRVVFILHEIDEQPMPVVAETLEIPLNTAYSRLRLARKRFASEVQAFRDTGRRLP